MSIKSGEKKNKINLPSLKKGLRLFNLRKSSDESSRNGEVFHDKSYKKTLQKLFSSEKLF